MKSVEVIIKSIISLSLIVLSGCIMMYGDRDNIGTYIVASLCVVGSYGLLNPSDKD